VAAGAVGIGASHSTEWSAEDRTACRHLAGRRSASSRHPRRCRLRQSLIAVARDTKIGRSPGRFGCAIETSIDWWLRPQIALHAKVCGAALLQRDWVAAQRGPIEKAINNGLEQKTIAAVDVTNQPSLLAGLAAKAQAVLVSGTTSGACQPGGNAFFSTQCKKEHRIFPARVHATPRNISHFKTLQNRHHAGQLTVSWIILAFGTTILFATVTSLGESSSR
jgi:hypothetical protein